MTGAARVVNVRGGARVCVPRDLRQYTPYILLEQEDWFEDEIRFVRRWLREGMHAVDVGASYGVYTLAMARAVGASGRVWAFEPTTAVAAHLEQSLAVNGLTNVALHRMAVSERTGPMDFHAGDYPELNAVAAAAAGAFPGAASGIQATTLDDFAKAHGVARPDFLKIDIEGHEAQAVGGAHRLLRDASPLVMVEIKALSSFDMTALRLLADLGYRAYRLLPGPVLLAPMDLDEPVSQFQLNAFACKGDRAAQLARDGFLADRPSLPSAAGATAATPYEQGLALYACSCDVGRSPNERVGCLDEAFRLLGEALASEDTLPGQLSYARVAAALLRREEALDALRAAIRHIEAEAASMQLKCGALEALERLRTFSSCFNPQPWLLDAIVALPGHSAEMERRRQLMRMVRGEQHGPEPAALLLERSEDNLNPEFWAGRA